MSFIDQLKLCINLTLDLFIERQKLVNVLLNDNFSVICKPGLLCSLFLFDYKLLSLIDDFRIVFLLLNEIKKTIVLNQEFQESYLESKKKRIDS